MSIKLIKFNAEQYEEFMTFSLNEYTHDLVTAKYSTKQNAMEMVIKGFTTY